MSAIDMPFEIPKGWRWVRLENLCASIADGDHQPPPQQNVGVPFLVISNVSSGKIDFTSTRFVNSEYFNALTNERKAKRGDLLVTVTGSYGIIVPVETDTVFCFQRHMALLKTIEPYNQYLAYCLQTPIVKAYFDSVATGSAQKTVGLSSLRATLLPFPPLAEQKRIVAKIEKLMPLVEEYGKMEETRLQLNADLPTTLEKSILQEAIQGKLVPQNPNDEPASELLKRVAAERKALVKAGKLKRDKGESVIFRGSDRLAYETRNGETVCIQDEIPFEIPDSWEWVRLGSVSNYGQCMSVAASDIKPNTWSLDMEEIEKGTGRLIERKTASEKRSKSSKHVFVKGTLLYSKLRTYLNKVLVADMDGVCTSEIVPVEFQGGITAEYVRLVLMSPYFLEYTASRGCGIKMPRVGTDDMKQSLIPLPPLGEQRRIVKWVEELRTMTRTLVTT